MSDTLILIIAFAMALSLAILSVFVLVSVVSRPVKASFVSLCISLSMWIVANTNADILLDNSLAWTRLSFLAATGMVASLVFFALVFPRRIGYFGILAAALGLITGVALPFSVSPLVAQDVVIINDYSNVVSGQGYGVYIAYIAAMVLSAISILLYRLKGENEANRNRLRYILIGTGLTAAIAGMTNLLLPAITGENPLAIYGSFAVLLFIFMVGQAIIRHNLFSIRVATARAVVYLLSGITLAVIFGFLIFTLSSYFISDQEVSTAQRLFYTVSAVFIGFLFPLVKKYFDNLTHSVLLRGEYDPETVLISISRLVAQSRSSHSLLESVAGELKKQLNISTLDYYLFSEEEISYGSSVDDWHEDSIKKVINSLSDQSVIRSFDFPSDMDREDISMILVLRTGQGLVGYFLVGYKQNGAKYNSNDINLLQAIASEVAIAAESFLRFEAIEKFNETLQKNIEISTQELRESNRKLRDADEAKDEFISMASHQLRTPLTSIKGYISMLLDGDIGEVTPAQRQALEEAYSSSQRMVYLISDFLNLSRLKTGKFIIERAPVVLSGIIEQEISQLRSVAKAKGINIKYQPPTDFPTLYLDETKVRQVMMNFIDNAIYYSKLDGGEVEIKLSKGDESVEFAVIDNGIGVPADSHEKLFTKFYRANNARKQRPDGTGIGLFMAKKVIIEHGGSMIFESQENVGSTFGFSLPLSDMNLGKQTDNAANQEDEQQDNPSDN